MYWSSNPGLRQHLIANSMSLRRFEEIKRFLHFADNNSQSNADKFYKLRPVLDVLEERFVAAMSPEEFQAVDEQIIPFKGQHSSKQYTPKKT